MKAADARLGKVYRRLPPKQAATLMLRHVAEGKQNEAERVRAAIPIRYGLAMRDPETLNYHNRIVAALSYWGSNHWRNQTAFICALEAALEAHRREDEQAAEEWCACLAQIQSRLLALDAALMAMSTRTGLPVDVLERLAHAEMFARFAVQPYAPPMLADGPDAAYLASVESYMCDGL